MAEAQTPLRVLIAGAGVGGLETALALGHLADDRVDVTLLAPDETFTYRPLAVAEPFAIGAVRRFELAPLVAAMDATLVRGSLGAVIPHRKQIRTTRGAELDYDVLVIAVGVRARQALPGAFTFRWDDPQRLRG